MPYQRDWAPVLKVIVVLASADILAGLFPEHNKTAFGVGLCLGVILQLAIPPTETWKKQILILLPIAILYGIVRALLFH